LANPIKQLAGQTAIYGLSTIIGRLLNYLLVPLHVAIFQPQAYGVVTELYAYAAFLAVILNYGMETAFFRYLNTEHLDKSNAFRTAFSSLLLTTTLFLAFVFFFQEGIANFILYPEHVEYVLWFALILGFDALSSLPMAKLRSENKAVFFASVNLISIGIVIALNLFFLLYCLPAFNAGKSNWLIDTFYNPDIGIGYIFIANLLGSMVKFLLLLPSMFKSKGKFDMLLLKTMLVYAFPLMFFGLAGIVNETFDRILLRRLLNASKGEEYAKMQVGIYGANYKLAMLITIFIQAFRYAAEPFFFAHEKQKDSRKTYAYIMQVFAGVVGALFLVVTLYMDLFKHIIIPNESYWSGLRIVPILLMANIFLGIYYNLGIWFKLSGKTKKGMYISVIGAVMTIGLNLWLIPYFEYMASAWITLATYFTITVISYFLGRKYYPVPYNIPRIAFYIFSPVLVYLILQQFTIDNNFIKYSIHSLILLTFIGSIYHLEFKGKKEINKTKN
jgi:O-antigen/teichoic acid export membrane protein